MTDHDTAALAAMAWSPDTEKNTLAAVLAGTNPLNLPVAAADFYQPTHEHLYQLILDIAADGKTPDPAIVYSRLNPTNRNHKGILDLLPELLSRGPSPNAAALADAVIEARRLRHLQQLTVRIHQAIHDGTDADTITAAIVADIQQHTPSDDGTRTLAQVMPEVIDRIEQGVLAGLGTPWPDLDRLIHGLRGGELVIIAGRPAQGKSLLGQNLATHWTSRHGKHVMLASMEMAATQIGTRIVADIAEVAQDHMMSPKTMQESDWDKIRQHSTQLNDTKLHLADQTSQTLAKITRQAHALHMRHGLGLVVVDYLQIIRPRDHSMIREQQISEISRGLKVLAQELDVPVVALSQFNRAGARDGNRKPQLTDLRESGSLEQDADVVIGIHRPEPEDVSSGQLIVLKARQGREGDCDVYMATQFARISSLSRDWDRPGWGAR